MWLPGILLLGCQGDFWLLAGDAKEKQELLQFSAEQQGRDGKSRLEVPGEFSEGNLQRIPGEGRGIPSPFPWICLYPGISGLSWLLLRAAPSA